MSIRIGTLGSAATFAGEGTQRMRELYPEFGNPAYFPTMEACWDALKDGAADVIILGIERTGQPLHGQRIVTEGFCVVGQLTLPLQCNLYARPGSTKHKIRKITGHGSLHQCTDYLDREFSGIPRETHGLNSVEAAMAVMAGDGTTAVVGSQSLPQIVPGLECLAAQIDSGALSSWWAVSAKPMHSDQPRRLIVTGRFGPDGKLGDLVVAVSAQGFRLDTAASFPVNKGVSIYDYLLCFSGKGKLSEVEHALAGFSGVLLAGAFEPRG